MVGPDVLDELEERQERIKRKKEERLGPAPDAKFDQVMTKFELR